MPCNGGPSTPCITLSISQYEKEKGFFTAALCSAMKFIEHSKRDAAFKEFHDPIESGIKFSELEKWWKNHKKLDKERTSKEAAELKNKLDAAKQLVKDIESRLATVAKH